MKVIVAENMQQAFEQIRTEYLQNGVVLGELLAMVEIRGLSVEDVVEVYKMLRREIDGWEVKEVQD